MREDTRAVSVNVGYALNLVIATIILGGVLIAAGGAVEDQSRTVIRQELTVVGHRLAAELMQADRLARVGELGREPPEVVVRTTLPRRVAGTTYTISVSDGELRLRSADPEVTVTVEFVSETSVTPATVDGGSVRIVYDPGERAMEVSEA
jgi:hypothetical protein